MPDEIEGAGLLLEGDVLVPGKLHPWFPFFCRRPTVNILFYTDDFSVLLDTGPDFGVGRLRDLITTHNTVNAVFHIDLVNRHDGGHAAHKLTPALLAGYDQIWIFGVLQCNLPGAAENELTDPEVAALDEWMSGQGRAGGVLITGDHSNPRPGGADPGLDPLVDLGRALGHRVPRAGRLRVWEGLPGSDPTGPTDTHDTQVADGLGTDLNNLALQSDQFPQNLLLQRYPVGFPIPWWSRRYRPHPLFCGRSGPITVFPDHMHEGALTMPSTFPPEEWPSGPSGQPLPEVVARGTDKRFPAIYDVVTAYDGAQAGVGRIVADSTWHHYFNVNLRGFTAGATLDAIADYYVNLAVWLSPPAVRQAMRCWIWWYLAVHPAVRMVAGGPIAVVGTTAYDVLGRHASQCTIVEFVWPFHLPIEVREKFPLPPEELVLGAVLREYHQAFDAALAGAGDLPERADLVARGLLKAAEVHAKELVRTAEATRAVPEELRARLGRLG